MTQNYWEIFCELIGTPFRNTELIWGIVPLYFGWLVNELTSNKASFRTALTTGFSFLWAGAHWTYNYFIRSANAPKISLDTLLAVNVAVTIVVIFIGLVALISGLRRKYPPLASFLGHARFSNYFMIAMFPIQANYLPWSWNRVIAILVFAIPLWVLLHLGLMPLRKK